MTRFRIVSTAAFCACALATSAAIAQPASMPMGSAASGSMSSVGMADKGFVTGAATGGMTEVELGKLAASKGTSQGIKDFGQKMVDDHTKAGDELKSIATSKGITPPASLDMMHQRLVDKFSAMPSGKGFDRSYHDQMVTDHKNTIALFTKESKSGKDADLKAFATKTLPTLKEHLQMLQAMKM